MANESEAYRRFMSSTRLDFDAWKDGTPYDVAALDEMSAAERAKVEAELSAKGHLDWRDVEALRRIGSPTAKARVKKAGYAQTDGAGAEAFKDDIAEGWTPAEEARFIRKLGAARHMEAAFDRLLSIAEAHPTDGVREALYRLATTGHEDVRYAYGAFLLYLNGHAEDWHGFDTRHRPQLLNLIHGNAEEREAASAWLLAKTRRKGRKAKA